MRLERFVQKISHITVYKNNQTSIPLHGYRGLDVQSEMKPYKIEKEVDGVWEKSF